MLEKLKRHWRVGGIQLVLIICIFALGGTLCGYAGKKLLELTGIEKGLTWISLYIIVISLFWPISVLLVSIPLGQFPFFKRYVGKIWARISGKKRIPVRIAVFASGAGSNAQRIIDKFRYSDSIKVALVVCNKPGAGVLGIAERENIPFLLINRKEFFEGGAYIEELKKYGIDFIILAGFLWKVPPALIKAYPNRIVNIHPALLPKYGGKGMYGKFVHEAVLAAGDEESGITIHYVDELYDHGKIIFQGRCKIEKHDTAETLAQKVHRLEHEHYPHVIEAFITNTNSPLK